jgi:hypothetical protein
MARSHSGRRILATAMFNLMKIVGETGPNQTVRRAGYLMLAERIILEPNQGRFRV